MSDVVVTVPRTKWAAWIAEGDLPGESWSGNESFFRISTKPKIVEADRVYIVAHGKLRGFARLRRLAHSFRGAPGLYLVRAGGAIPVTIAAPIRGFQGWRYRWWAYEDEIPFPEWRTL